jgi:RNA polymerase sigma-70 factor (ECF subfamily)
MAGRSDPSARDRDRDRGTGFIAWLITIARNAAIDSHRRRTVAGRFALLGREPGWSPSTEDLVVQDETDRILAQRLQELSPPLREVILLRFAAGLSARGIGRVIGRTEGASAKLFSRALATLKEAYRDELR